MSKFDLPENFTELVANTYNEAADKGDVVFTESTTKFIDDDDFQFAITFAPSLAKKPTQEKAPEQEARPENFNPFLNPDPKLTVVAGYADDYNILLNKFPITPNHLLLTTKEFKSQNAPLSPDDLIASFKILAELEKSSTSNEKFMGFYNCGDNSGASQPHKHLQFMKYPDNFTPFPASIAASEEHFIANSNKEPLQSPKLPFAHFILPLPKDKETLYDEDYLVLAFSSLLQRVMTILRDAEKPIAYNVVFTTKWMMVVPRSQPYYKGKLGINSAGFTGLILAKNQELNDLILEDGPLKILEEVGFPNTSGQPTDEYHY
ncbi:APA2 [Cyberlindnera jadinii]|uniref:APA2 protein n=1 Tax=Cyberlindnera jadinii (strain ATCC 18201 / CBS 1600 / BCRC 20928 / JCM 3617 / NBRC 0987 / NRRL Y-1542) TaxID=983966 RepID=A0A0H5C1N6_CYBJN|nr:ATP adenylyltransferase [Cyberlindnera jadinii NRRL Y-1542]ODV72190.1 ATP adenylyltransferase [Cyberlindnera jadinii NRRL Y-1542]CEP21765.1 APA2 [Cyberlindnera jadinii]